MRNILLFLTFCSTNLFASNILFCQNPIKYTCDNSKASAIRHTNISKIEEKLKTDAFLLLKRSSDNDPIISELKNYNEIDNLSPAKIKKRIQKQFFNKVQITFGNYLSENKINSDLGLLQIKNALINTISSANNISSEIKSKIIETINSTKLISMQSNIEESTITEVTNLYKQCARKSFVDNAFATSLSGQKVIMVCPGEIIGTIEQLKEKNIPTTYYTIAEAMTLGHELSHHFDYRYFPEIYTDTLNYAYDNRDAFNTNPEKYMSEITADVWGIKAFLNLTKNMNPESQIYSKIISTSLNDLCDTEDDNQHPTGDFRIDKLASHFICN